MSDGRFLLALAAGAALLAIWTHVRFPAFAPARLLVTVVHTGIAMLLLNITPLALETGINTYFALFGLVLPSLVYAMLAALWMLKLAQTALGFQR
jgi:hypothetical protein